MNIGFRIFVVLLYLLAALPNASAQDQAAPSKKEGVDQIIKSMDKDGDGTISKTEAPTDLKLFFADYDKNSDGQIDNDEAVAIAKWVEANKTKPGSPADLAQQKAQAKKWIATVDKDGDGKINQKEAPQKLKDYFGMFDTDADGKIDANEALKILPHVNQAAAKNSASDNQTTKPGRLTAEQLIASMDRNGNKCIDSDEAPEQLATNFAYIDTNSDDKIDSDEALTILPHITAEQARGILAMLEAQNINETPAKPKAAPEKLTAEQLIASMDRNGNKSIDSDEAPGELAPHFASIDTNSDNKIDSGEAAAILPHITAEQTRDILAALEAHNINGTK